MDKMVEGMIIEQNPLYFPTGRGWTYTDMSEIRILRINAGANLLSLTDNIHFLHWQNSFLAVSRNSWSGMVLQS